MQALVNAGAGQSLVLCVYHWEVKALLFLLTIVKPEQYGTSGGPVCTVLRTMCCMWSQ